jgi:hypothetical protein
LGLAGPQLALLAGHWSATAQTGERRAQILSYQLETTMTNTTPVTNLRDNKMMRLAVIGILFIIVAYLLYSVF